MTEFEEKGGELDEGRDVVHGRKQPMLATEDPARLVERHLADPMNPLADDGPGQPPLGDSSPQRLVDAGVEEEPPVAEQKLGAVGQVGFGPAEQDQGAVRIARAGQTQLLAGRDFEGLGFTEDQRLAMRDVQAGRLAGVPATDQASQEAGGDKDRVRLDLPECLLQPRGRRRLRPGLFHGGENLGSRRVRPSTVILTR